MVKKGKIATMGELKISKLHLKNFRSIKDSNIFLDRESIIIGKNNIGKTSLLEVFSAFDNHLQISDFNIDLLLSIMNNLDNPAKLSEESCISLNITYCWSALSPDYWTLLSDISNSGETIVKVKYFIPEENYEALSKITSVEQLLPLFIRKICIGSKNDFQNKTETTLAPSISIRKLLPVFKYKLDSVQPGEILLYPIMAFRYVNAGQNSNDETTANQFSSKILRLLSSNPEIKESFDRIQDKVNSITNSPMSSFQDELKEFAYPKDPEHPLQAILTIDEWLQNPKIRIAQTFNELSKFELPLKAQGLGYQNIYNILARITFLFTKMTELDLHNPVIIAIEEPEAFTHPQLQHVFIQQIREFVKKNSKSMGISYQLIIISHSPEIAVSAFEMNFQIVVGRKKDKVTKFINWDSLGKADTVARTKLKKLILNYNAELLFADKLIAYEGNAERLIFSSIIRKEAPSLLGEKVAYLPVGTSFRNLQSALADLKFEKILLITDIDFKMNSNGTPQMQEGITTTNKNIQYLFNCPLSDSLNKIKLDALYNKKEEFLCEYCKLLTNKVDHVDNPHEADFAIFSEGYNKTFKFWPRTLESALVTASKKNVDLYNHANLLKKDAVEKLNSYPFIVNHVEDELLTQKKADFALNSLELISKEGYAVPSYLKEGLHWLEN
jgi:predicted ATP-dependent endonuclease of OLD family